MKYLQSHGLSLGFIFAVLVMGSVLTVASLFIVQSIDFAVVGAGERLGGGSAQGIRSLYFVSE